jgi:hypothetical protein
MVIPSHITVDDQILPLRALSGMPQLLGYEGTAAIAVLRVRGRLIPAHRLHYASRRLEAIALALREIARATPKGRVTKIRGEMYSDLGLVLGDSEAK